MRETMTQAEPLLDVEAAVKTRYSARVLLPLEEAPPFPCAQGTLRRDPRETKGEGHRLTTEAAPARGPGEGGGCC